MSPSLRAPIESDEKSCWVTLVTNPSYVPGLLILAYTLDKHHSEYPLVVQYTDSLGEKVVAALREEAEHHGRMQLEKVSLLLPARDQQNTGSVAARFKDTFTKLRAFEVYKLGFTRAVFLDADMAVFQNPDEIFECQLPSREWLGANHACVCNLDKDSWAPSEWQKGNCAYTPLDHPNEIADVATPGCRPTYRLLNGGMFLFYPTERLWMRMLRSFETTDRLKGYQFPDQDFLADFFYDKWYPMSWKYNALKTMRYWHPQMWSDEKLVVLHYIVDKPWERLVSGDGVAGHLGRDGETHQWWWNVYHEWKEDRRTNRPKNAVLPVVEDLVNTQEPYTERTPLKQDVGKPEDVLPYPQRDEQAKDMSGPRALQPVRN